MPIIRPTIPTSTFLNELPVDPLRISSKSLELEMARRHLLDFTTYTFPGYQVNWHHKVLCDYLERWERGEIKRLMVFMPPGTGKSELVSRRLPAWIFGRHPDTFVMGASYSASLIQDMSLDVQRIMSSDEYKEIFPNVRLPTDKRQDDSLEKKRMTAEVFELLGHSGYYKCAGVGGSITGKRFFYGIIDDPVRGRKDAESKTFRDTTYNWYINDFYTRRLNNDARILITLTRWHQEDLAGKLLENAANNPTLDPWTVLRLPMVAEDDPSEVDPRSPGEVLWPERFGDASEVEKIKIEAGSYVWSSMYQQSPTVSGGAVFNRGWWKFYHINPDVVDRSDGKLTLLPERFDDQTQSWDLTFGDGANADYVVGTVWGRVGADKFLLDMYRKQIDFPETIKQFRLMSQKWPLATRKLVEEAANGKAMIATLRHEIPGIIAVPARSSKEVRARAAAPEVEAGNVYLPHASISGFVNDFIEELSIFPNGAHDDMCDSFSQYINNTRITNVKLPKIPNKIIRVGGGWE